MGSVIQRTHSYTAVLITLGAIIVPGTVAWIVWPVASLRRA
jgi:hypothetical protein